MNNLTFPKKLGQNIASFFFFFFFDWPNKNYKGKQIFEKTQKKTSQLRDQLSQLH